MSTQSEKLASDIKVLVQDAEELVKATATETGAKVVELRRRMQQTVDDVKPHIVRFESAAIDRVKPAATAVDQYARAHPWPAVGVGALVGLVIGLLASRN